jgi:hypothetical protein
LTGDCERVASRFTVVSCVNIARCDRFSNEIVRGAEINALRCSGGAVSPVAKIPLAMFRSADMIASVS